MTDVPEQGTERMRGGTLTTVIMVLVGLAALIFIIQAL